MDARLDQTGREYWMENREVTLPLFRHWRAFGTIFPYSKLF